MRILSGPHLVGLSAILLAIGVNEAIWRHTSVLDDKVNVDRRFRSFQVLLSKSESVKFRHGRAGFHGSVSQTGRGVNVPSSKYDAQSQDNCHQCKHLDGRGTGAALPHLPCRAYWARSDFFSQLSIKRSGMLPPYLYGASAPHPACLGHQLQRCRIGSQLQIDKHTQITLGV